MNPIIVNERLEVIDGQNRLSALKDLGLPVHYYVVRGATIETARSLNLGRSNWKPLDYCKSYAESGVRSYQLLLDLMQDSEHIGIKLPLQEAYGVLKRRVIYVGNQLQDLQKGKFSVTEDDYLKALRSVNLLKETMPEVSLVYGSKRIIITGLAYCFSVDGCNTRSLDRKSVV